VPERARGHGRAGPVRKDQTRRGGARVRGAYDGEPSRRPDARELTLALGGRWSGQSGTARCPTHEDRHPSLWIADGPDGLPRVHCHAGCDWRVVRAELVRRGLLPGRDGPGPDRAELARRALEREWAQRREREAAEAEALAAWRRGRPLEAGDLGDRYLGHRGIPAPRGGWPPSLRLGTHTGGAGRSWPALLAAACRWPDRTPAAAQLTPLREPGQKVWTRPARLTFGDLHGAAVRLAPWQPGRRIVLVEGVEDGLAVLAACPEVTPWAVLGAANAGTVRLPAGAEIALCLDGDEAGRRRPPCPPCASSGAAAPGQRRGPAGRARPARPAAEGRGVSAEELHAAVRDAATPTGRPRWRDWRRCRRSRPTAGWRRRPGAPLPVVRPCARRCPGPRRSGAENRGAAGRSSCRSRSRGPGRWTAPRSSTSSRAGWEARGDDG
jgi:hypothetical protein